MKKLTNDQKKAFKVAFLIQKSAFEVSRAMSGKTIYDDAIKFLNEILNYLDELEVTHEKLEQYAVKLVELLKPLTVNQPVPKLPKGGVIGGSGGGEVVLNKEERILNK